MLRSVAVSCMLLAVMFGASHPAAGGVITIGGPPAAIGGISVPFAGGLRYQQIYNSNQFTTGPVSITGITFFDTVDTGGEIDNTTYTISLSTSAKPVVDGLSLVFADNRGADEQPFFNGILSGTLAGSELNISGTPFNYDPSKGNLLLEIVKASNPSENTQISMDSSNGGSPGTFSHLRFNGTTTVAENNFGLVTRFETQAGVVIPEPSTATLAGLAALLLCGYWRYRARRCPASGVGV